MKSIANEETNEQLAEKVFLSLRGLEYKDLYELQAPNMRGRYFCEVLGCDPDRLKKQGNYALTQECRYRVNMDRRSKNRIPEIVCEKHKGALFIDPAHYEYFGIK